MRVTAFECVAIRLATNSGDGQIRRVGDLGHLVAQNRTRHNRPGGDRRVDAEHRRQPDHRHAERTDRGQRTPQHVAQCTGEQEHRDVEVVSGQQVDAVVDDRRHRTAQVQGSDQRTDRQDHKQCPDHTIDPVVDGLGDHGTGVPVPRRNSNGDQRCQRHAHLQRAVGDLAAEHHHRHDDQQDHRTDHEQRRRHRRLRPTSARWHGTVVGAVGGRTRSGLHQESSASLAFGTGGSSLIPGSAMIEPAT